MNRPEIFVGFDSREEEAVDVLNYSIKKHCNTAYVTKIIQSDLRDKGLYTRPSDPMAATEFSLTRFLVPALMDYQGWAVFMDCDMLVTANIKELFRLANPIYAVQVVKHYHQPIEKTKMDNCMQTLYPKKNWSSVVLWNCGHRKNKNITADVVNSVQPSFLHRFEWLNESDIGELPLTWNFLVDYYKIFPGMTIPKNIHWTSGGPWFEEYKNVDYSDIWNLYRDEMKENYNG